MTENPINIGQSQFNRILMKAKASGAETTFEWDEYVFDVSSAPDENVALRLDLKGPGDCVLVELSPVVAKSASYPDDLPFVSGQPVRYGLVGNTSMAFWWIGPDREKLEQAATDSPEILDEETREVTEKYARVASQGGEEAEGVRAELKKVIMERAKRVREDPELRQGLEDRLARMKEALGDGAEIKEIFKTVLRESELAGWVRGEVKGDDDADWRGATLEREDRTRTLFMQAPGPVGMVMLQDMPTSEVQPASCES